MRRDGPAMLRVLAALPGSYLTEICRRGRALRRPGDDRRGASIEVPTAADPGHGRTTSQNDTAQAGKSTARSHMLGKSPTPRGLCVNSAVPAPLGYLLDELRLAGTTTYSDLATTLNRQGLRPARGRWTAHALHLAMRRHRRAHPASLANVGWRSTDAGPSKRDVSFGAFSDAD